VSHDRAETMRSEANRTANSALIPALPFTPREIPGRVMRSFFASCVTESGWSLCYTHNP
jgi:hypothetical protein